jgi:hypothetical protein
VDFRFFDTSFGAMRARLRTAASNLLISLWGGSIDQAIPTCVHYMRGPGPKWYEKNGRNREAAGIVQRPVIVMTGGIYK